MGGETTEMSATTTNVLIEAAHWDAVSMFRTGKRHKITSEAGKRNERGVDPTICPAAADRVVELLVEHGGGTAERRRHRRRHAARAAVDPRSATTCRPGSPASTSTPTTVVAQPRRRSAATVDADADGVTVDPAAVAPRPHRPVRPGRGGRPDRRLRPGAVGAAARGRRPRPDPRRSGCAAGSVARWPVPAASRWSASRSSATRPSTRSGCPRTTYSGPRCALANPLSAEEPAYTTTLLPGAAQGRRAQPRTRRSGRGPVRDRDRGVPGRPRPGADLRRRPAAGRGRARRSCSTRCPGSRSTWRSSWPASGSGPAGGAMAAPPAGPTRSGWSAGSPTELGVDVEVRPAQPDALAPGPLCRSSPSADAALGHAGELHPQVCAGVRAARRGARRSRSTSTC